MNSTKIKCPTCNTDIDVNEVMYHHLETEMEGKYARDFKLKSDEIEQEKRFLEAEKQALEKSRLQQTELIDKEVTLKLKQERSNMESNIKQRLEGENSEMFTSMQRELQEKSEKLKQFNKAQSEIETLKREKNELETKIEAESQKKFNELLALEIQKVKKVERDNSEFKVKELEKKLEEQIEMTNQMKRKQEQGSVQLQGEVQELCIEDFLRSAFPLDTITEVKKGARGADCIHIINSRQKENCGSVYYESKRTKDFGSGWIEKFKNDIRENGATVGILVTDAMPAGMERMGLKDGVWVCSYDEFKGLSAVIREYIILLDAAVASQENKGEKMQMLYDYLTSYQFKASVEGILDAHRQMKEEFGAEKRTIMSYWKRRDKQLEKVLLNTSDIYNSIHGIAGKAIQRIDALEFPDTLGIEKSSLFQ